MENALGEMEYITKYGYVVVNDTVDAAVSRMEAIVAAERLRRERVLAGTSWREIVDIEMKGV